MTATAELLLTDLANYSRCWPEDSQETLQRYRGFVESTPDCCERSHADGHCTGSAFLSCPRGERVLLLFHPHLKRWLQPGGHADGNFDLLDVARREAEEETGLTDLLAYSSGGLSRVPFDLDIHPIPARGVEKEHFHYDLRFLFLANPETKLVPETPQLQLAWLDLDKVEKLTDEESVLRMVRKLRLLPRSADGLLAPGDTLPTALADQA